MGRGEREGRKGRKGKDSEESEGDDRYWEQLDSRWYTTLNLASGAESKEEWCGPKCKKGHVMVHSSYKGNIFLTMTTIHS